jgi:hypothetical protein
LLTTWVVHHSWNSGWSLEKYINNLVRIYKYLQHVYNMGALPTTSFFLNIYD